jgi:hypothetical protein
MDAKIVKFTEVHPILCKDSENLSRKKLTKKAFFRDFYAIFALSVGRVSTFVQILLMK